MPPRVSEMPPLWATVAALRSSAARPPVIGNARGRPVERRRADHAGRDAEAGERLERARVEREGGVALGEQLRLARLRLHAHLAERDPALERA